MAAIFARSLMRGGIYSSAGIQPRRPRSRRRHPGAVDRGAAPLPPAQNPWAVPAARSARNTTTSADSAITPTSRRTISRTTRALLVLGQRADRLGVGELALVEDRLRRGDAQLLGDEADRERQQRVQVEELIGRVVTRRRERADGEREHERRRPARRAAAARRRPRARSLGSPSYHSHAPSSPAAALSAATTIAPATTACVMRPARERADGAPERVSEP